MGWVLGEPSGFNGPIVIPLFSLSSLWAILFVLRERWTAKEAERWRLAGGGGSPWKIKAETYVCNVWQAKFEGFKEIFLFFFPQNLNLLVERELSSHHCILSLNLPFTFTSVSLSSLMENSCFVSGKAPENTAAVYILQWALIFFFNVGRMCPTFGNYLFNEVEEKVFLAINKCINK